MIPVVVLSRDKIAGQIATELKKFFTVSIITEDNIEIEEDSEVLVVESFESSQINIKNGILISKQPNDMQVCKGARCIVVADSSDMSLLQFGNSTVAQCITCGMSSKDTVTFSSIEDNEVTVSLMRQIKDLNGNIVEPFEVSVCSKNLISGYSPFYLLCIVTVITLLGKGISGLKLLIE